MQGEEVGLPSEFILKLYDETVNVSQTARSNRDRLLGRAATPMDHVSPSRCSLQEFYSMAAPGLCVDSSSSTSRMDRRSSSRPSNLPDTSGSSFVHCSQPICFWAALAPPAHCSAAPLVDSQTLTLEVRVLLTAGR